MITKEERIKFKHYLLDNEITIKEFCALNGANYGSFRMALNGICPAWRNYDRLIKDAINNTATVG